MADVGYPRHMPDISVPQSAQVRSPSVLVFFGDDPARVYQLAQWLPVLELLDSTEPVAIVVRLEETADVVRPLTALPVVLAEDFPQLRSAYAALDAKVGLYVNNSMRNFQALLETRMLHVHINHGESDKQSMASNNAKAYDRLFVAGEAAVQRVAAGLLEFDTAKLVRIGRPQLDLRKEPVLPPSASPDGAVRPDLGGRRGLQQLLVPRPVRTPARPQPARRAATSASSTSRTPGRSTARIRASGPRTPRSSLCSRASTPSTSCSRTPTSWR